MINVPQVGEEDQAQANTIPKSILVGIIQPRLEETFEMVRSRLETSGFDKIAGRRVVLTGGASQLAGVRELAQLVLDKQVRMGRPIRIGGLAEVDRRPGLRDRRGPDRLRPAGRKRRTAAESHACRRAERPDRPARELAEGEFLSGGKRCRERQ